MLAKAVALNKEKNRTNTSEDREIELCPRALKVLRTQLAVRERRVSSGEVRHQLFFLEDGTPFESHYLPYNRWCQVPEPIGLRYRKPYNTRHTFISWRLMKGGSPLLVAQDGVHNVATTLRTYAA